MGWDGMGRGGRAQSLPIGGSAWAGRPRRFPGRRGEGGAFVSRYNRPRSPVVMSDPGAGDLVRDAGTSGRSIRVGGDDLALVFRAERPDRLHVGAVLEVADRAVAEHGVGAAGMEA